MLSNYFAKENELFTVFGFVCGFFSVAHEAFMRAKAQRQELNVMVLTPRRPRHSKRGKATVIQIIKMSKSFNNMRIASYGLLVCATAVCSASERGHYQRYTNLLTNPHWTLTNGHYRYILRSI